MEGPFEGEYGSSVLFLQGFSSLIFWGFGPSFLDLSCTALHGTEVLVEWDSATHMPLIYGHLLEIE
jgi:hypothetical protein